MIRHNPQTGNLSSSDDEDQAILVPTNEMITNYNSQYSAIIRQIQKFLKQAAESVQKFVYFHNLGVGFDLPHLLNNICRASNNFKLHLASSQRQAQDPKKQAKDKYQFSFNKIMSRMSDLLKDLVDCEVEFKQSYFGIQKNQESNDKSKLKRSLSGVDRSTSSFTKSSISEKIKLHQFIENEAKEDQREAELRATLKQKLKPKATAPKSECQPLYSTTENLYRLNQKIQFMFNDMKAVRNRQQKLIELFNLNRVKKLHVAAEKASSPLNSSTISQIAVVAEEDQDREQVDLILDNWRGRQSPSQQLDDVSSNFGGFLKKRTIY